MVNFWLDISQFCFAFSDTGRTVSLEISRWMKDTSIPDKQLEQMMHECLLN